MSEKSCGIILYNDSTEVPNLQKIKQDFEKGTDEVKREALKKVIYLLLNGDKVQQLMVPIIRYVTPCKDHFVKKLLLIYWELVDKQNTGDALLLACNALMRDLTYPNEYVRGSTLRFLCKLSDEEILGPLVEAVKTNLKHRLAYVRRNAVLASYSIVKDHPHLFPNGIDLVHDQLLVESDPSCKRNMFIMLFNCAQDRAIAYLSDILDQIQSFGEILQLIVVEMIRKAVRTHPEDRGRYLKCIFSLLSSNSSAVQFESAHTLVSLSVAPTSIRAAASTYINLLIKESDNNVKLIVLDRLAELQKKHAKILQKLTMDILRVLVSPNMEIRSKTLSIALDLVTPTNIGEVVMVFKKEMNRTQNEAFEDANQYRRMLVKAIHQCAVKFPDVAHDVVYVLLDFVGDDDVESAYDVIDFVREVVQTYPHMRDSILGKLVSSFDQIKAGNVFRATLWILGEYSVDLESLRAALTILKDNLGQPDFARQADQAGKEQEKAPLIPVAYSGPRILNDGTYATSSSLNAKVDSIVHQSTGVKSLRQCILGGDYYTASVLATTFAKLYVKIAQFPAEVVAPTEKNEWQAQILLFLTAFLQLLKHQSNLASSLSKKDVDRDSYERICLCFQIITQGNKAANEVLLHLSRQSYALYLEQHIVEDKNKPATQVDDLIKIRQLKPKSNANQADLEEEQDLNKATGQDENAEDYSAKLERIVQLTGYSDPIYAEADINVHQYDITLGDTLQNLCLELATLGDLKLVERPQNYTLAPYTSKNIKAHIKVSSTETGVIFGSIVYDIAGSSNNEKTIILNEIRIDVIDYISPAFTDDATFRSLWSAVDWENKVVVQTSFDDLNKYLEHIITSTNMRCLTPASALVGDCGFLSANLYARSVFGEDALANVSIEQSPENNKISGVIRISLFVRSKTQGIAVSLGKKAEHASART